jgi:short-subunit dehydrogenase
MELRGAVAVVTGTSAGIGRATAVALAREGATVVVSARREDRLAEVVASIEEGGGKATAARADMAVRADVAALAERVRGEHGRCDVLVNNAGIPGGGPFTDLSWEQIQRIVDVNYVTVLACTKAFLPMMLDAGRGHVVNVASLAGRFATPGSSVYSSTKHAVVAFSEALHFEISPRGVLVTAVNPGLVATEGFPHTDAIRKGRRVMKPERVADLIVDVVKRGKAPEVSIPRALAALQIVRLIAPPLYRFGMRKAVSGSMRPTRVGESD